PVDGEPAQRLRRQYPVFTVDVIPAHVYRDVPSTITLGVGALWVVSAELEPELVYGITRALWHKSTRRLLDDGSPLGRRLRVDTALNAIPIPLHPGAARYYNEVSQAPLPSASQ